MAQHHLAAFPGPTQPPHALEAPSGQRDRRHVGESLYLRAPTQLEDLSHPPGDVRRIPENASTPRRPGLPGCPVLLFGGLRRRHGKSDGLIFSAGTRLERVPGIKEWVKAPGGFFQRRAPFIPGIPKWRTNPLVHWFLCESFGGA